MTRPTYDVLLALVFIALAMLAGVGCNTEVAQSSPGTATEAASASPDAEAAPSDDLDSELDTLEAEIGR